MSEIKCTHSCSDCSRLGCRSASEDQYPPFCLTTNVDRDLLDETLEIYRNDELQGRIARTSACIEGEFYGRLTRVEETIEFIRRMGFKKIGIASCVGLMRETSIFARILKASGIDYFTVGCKVGAVDKTEIGVPNEKSSTAAAATSPCATRSCRRKRSPRTAATSISSSACASVTIRCSCVTARFRPPS